MKAVAGFYIIVCMVAFLFGLFGWVFNADPSITEFVGRLTILTGATLVPIMLFAALMSLLEGK